MPTAGSWLGDVPVSANTRRRSVSTHPRVRLLKSDTIYRGKVLELKVDQVIEPGGVKATREVVCHLGSVVLLPRLADGRIVLVRQFRYPARQWLWELVAGRLEPGEKVREAARRELIEETGYRARIFRPFLTFFPSPGFLTEKMHLVEARHLVHSKARAEADERIEVGRFTRSELARMFRKKEIRDGKTLVGLLWLFGLNSSRI